MVRASLIGADDQRIARPSASGLPSTSSSARSLRAPRQAILARLKLGQPPARCGTAAVGLNHYRQEIFRRAKDLKRSGLRFFPIGEERRPPELLRSKSDLPTPARPAVIRAYSSDESVISGSPGSPSRRISRPSAGARSGSTRPAQGGGGQRRKPRMQRGEDGFARGWHILFVSAPAERGGSVHAQRTSPRRDRSLTPLLSRPGPEHRRHVCNFKRFDKATAMLQPQLLGAGVSQLRCAAVKEGRYGKTRIRIDECSLQTWTAV